MAKIERQCPFKWETALCWALNAKNCFISVHGYSPYQIVFGKNPNLPSNVVNSPPALEKETYSDVMREHLIGLHEARKAFIAAESSEKIRRALKKQVRPKDEQFSMGDKVYFLRDNKWEGPGVVMGQDNVVVFVRHGGTYVRVHTSRLLRERESSSLDTECQTNILPDQPYPDQKANDEISETITTEVEANESETDSDDEPNLNQNDHSPALPEANTDINRTDAIKLVKNSEIEF